MTACGSSESVSRSMASHERSPLVWCLASKCEQQREEEEHVLLVRVTRVWVRQVELEHVQGLCRARVQEVDQRAL
eukprot:6180139-Pleurochrysis_carterae.AAC.3